MVSADLKSEIKVPEGWCVRRIRDKVSKIAWAQNLAIVLREDASVYTFSTCCTALAHSLASR